MRLPFRKSESELLQECLEALAAGEPLEEVLARHPERESSLRPALEAAGWLGNRRAAVSPGSEWVQKARRQLEVDLQAELTARARLKRKLSRSYARLRVHFQAAAIALLIMVFLNVAGQVMFAARSTLPGDFLFPLKRLPEQIRWALMLNPVDETRLGAYIAQKRAVELQELLIEGRYDDLALGVELLQRDLARVQRDINQIARRNPQLAQSLQEELASLLEEQFFILSLLSGHVPEGVSQTWNQVLVSLPH
jgi:hypothetical protein